MRSISFETDTFYDHINGAMRSFCVFLTMDSSKEEQCVATKFRFKAGLSAVYLPEIK